MVIIAGDPVPRLLTEKTRMRILSYFKKQKRCDLVGLGALAATAIIQMIHVALYVPLGDARSLAAVTILGAVFVLFGLFCRRARLPVLWAGAAAACIVLHCCSNIPGFIADLSYAFQGAVAVIACLAGSFFQLRERARPAFAWISLAAFLTVAAFGASVWLGSVAFVNAAGGRAQREVWAVPDKYDEAVCPEPGSVQELVYETRAYATDGRVLTKRALVYLPYGYTEEKEYNILYLLHGTGDDEEYWLRTNPQNKAMLDNLIYYGDISPLIVVTPTWYEVPDGTWEESVCEPLIDSFNAEFRNDLIPAAEGRYSTYAGGDLSADSLIASRRHRAFTGLSRGASATYRSALCGSLDYVSWFGAFSGCGTDEAYFEAHLRSEALREYPIDYLYNTSGTFDFALRGHVREFEELLATESRLVPDQNCSMDVLPMRYHSMGSWHIALYNFLLLIFP